MHGETLARFALVRQQALLYQITQRYYRVIFPVWTELSHFGPTIGLIRKRSKCTRSETPQLPIRIKPHGKSAGISNVFPH